MKTNFKSIAIFTVFSLFLLIALSFSACKKEPEPEPTAQNGNISGTVKDLSGTPLENVVISAEGLEEKITNSQGIFTYTDVEAKSYTLKATKMGYIDKTLNVSVVGNKTVAADIKLTMGIKPNVSINLATNITMTAAKVAGRILLVGDAEITAYGHCWSTSSSPTIADNSTNFGTTTQESAFESSIASMKSGTQYYVRAYATNKYGTKYSDQITFFTLPGEAVLLTNAATEIEFNMAKITGNISSTGLGTISQHGHVWSKNPNPTVNDFKTELGIKPTTGNFTSTVTGLEMEVTYYIRAYAINDAGIVYSNQESFTTTKKFKDKRDSKWYNIVKIGNQIWMQQNLNYSAANSNCYEYNDSYCGNYGGLYNWATAQGVAPEGWRLPTLADWNTLITGLGGESLAGGKMKDANVGGTISIYWTAPNLGATNTSGFTALGSGYLSNIGASKDENITSFFWTSASIDANNAKCVRLDKDTETAPVLNYNKEYSFSVRCILIQ